MVELTWLIQIIAVCAGVGTGAFVLAEILGFFDTRSAINSIVQTSSVAINAQVAMTGVATTASQAATVTEISGVPTQIIPPETPAK